MLNTVLCIFSVSFSFVAIVYSIITFLRNRKRIRNYIEESNARIEHFEQHEKKEMERLRRHQSEPDDDDDFNKLPHPGY